MQYKFNIFTGTFDLVNAAGTGGLTQVTADAPLTGLGTSVSHLSIPKATALVDGYLDHTDFATFLGKQDSLGLTDPGSNTIAGWDDTDNAWKWFVIGANLSYNHATHTLSASGSSMTWPAAAGIAVYSGSSSWSTSISGTSSQFVKGDGSLDSSTYLTTVTAHNILSTTHGDTAAGSVVRGDIMYGNATPKWDRLAFPATPTGKVLQATATDVAWSSNPLTIGASASVSGSNTGDQPKLPTYVVAASGGDYTTIQAALDAIAGNGGIIYLTDASYTITTGLLFKGSFVRLEGNWYGTQIKCNGASVTTLLKSNTTTYTDLQLANLRLTQTNATAQGIAIDASNISRAIYDNIYIEDFGTAIKFNDTANNTFYNTIRNVVIIDCNNGIDITSTNPVNDNAFYSIRIALKAGGAGTGLKITNGQNNNFYNLNCEPGTGAGITGIALTTSNTYDTNFYGVYLESNATNISIGTGVKRTSFIGGQSSGALTTNISDLGIDTTFINLDDGVGGLARNQLNPFVAIDSGSSSQTFDFKNNTNYAHAASTLVKFELLNGTDTSAVLTLANAGTGNYITADSAFSVSKGGTILATGSLGATGARLVKGWFADLQVTNAITGSVSGNAGTVTNGVYTTSQVTVLAATAAGDYNKYLHANASTGALEWVAGSTAGATVALDNLATVAINTSLLPGTTNSIDLGSTTKTFRNIYLTGTADPFYIRLHGTTPTGTQTVTFPDRTLTIDNITTSTTTNGTGFVKGNGTVISFDNSTYLTSVTAHNILSTTHGDTLADTVVRGDIIYGNATPKWARLAFPATPTGKILQATATDVAWSANPLTIGASASVSGSNTGDQDLSGYALLAGRAGGQTLNGGTLTTNLLVLRANAADLTSGYVHFTDTTTASSSTVGGVVMDGGLAVAKRIYSLDMTVTNAITGGVTGNAGTATKLAATKNINGVAFDGSADVVLPSTYWSIVTGDTSMAVNYGYIANKSSLVTFTLPSTAAVGTMVRVTGINTGGWKIAQNASGIIHFGNTDTTTGTGGYIASVNVRDSVQLVCVVANNEWQVVSSIGNITIA